MKKILNKKGFTIVELVIVIAVIAILAAVLIPTFSNVIDSANKSSDLSEAQNTLKAYTAYTSSKGQTLNDGTVFKVTKSGRSYVFYKGSLHEFKERDNTGEYGAIVAIGNTNYKTNKMTAHYLNDNGEDAPFETTTVKDDKGGSFEAQVVFFYSNVKNVTFEDGSLNCKIYPGCIAYVSKDGYSLSEDGTYKFNSPRDSKNAIALTGIVNLTFGETNYVIKVVSEDKSVIKVYEYKESVLGTTDVNGNILADGYTVPEDCEKFMKIDENKKITFISIPSKDIVLTKQSS